MPSLKSAGLDRISRRSDQDFRDATDLQRQGKTDEAETLYRAILQDKPDHAGAMRNLGLIWMLRGKVEDALGLFSRELAADHASPWPRFTMAMALQALNRHEEAVPHFQRGLDILPSATPARFNLAVSLQKLCRYEDAMTSYAQVVASQPGMALAHSGLGDCCKVTSRYREAILHYERALAIDPDLTQAHNNLANVLATLKYSEQAVRHYARAIAIQPDLASAHNNLGLELVCLGKLDEARIAFEAAIALDGKKPEFYRNVATVTHFVEGDPHLTAMQRLSDVIATLAPQEQIDLHFALGKALADTGRHVLSFRHVLDGNALKRQRIPYDEPAAMALFDRIRTVFTPALMQKKSVLTVPSALPVFIVGMPRSGSTLVEQILASHPSVHGAGETLEFAMALEALNDVAAPLPLFPEVAEVLSAEQLRQLGHDYVARITADAPSAPCITNKLPDNFLLVGLIHLALPNARIIHTCRDPVDTCFSYFAKLFQGSKPYTNDLAELGRYYRAYAALMRHWHRVLPAGTILDVQYEDVVDHLEAQARRIVAYLGLPWDDACLVFHKTERPVRTGSAAQVRQPLYRSAIGRSRPYREMLGPLLDALVAG
jgi:tetratricopeptide (TPR) repeat protein